MYEAWQQDPKSVHISWQSYFSNVEKGLAPGTAFKAPPTLIPDHDLAPSQFTEGLAKVAGGSSTEILDHMKVQMLVRAYQVRGHHLANLDPLGILQADLNDSNPPELEYQYYGFTEADLDRSFHLGPGMLPGFSKDAQQLKLRDIIKVLKSTYCTSWY
jgi:2-oxoglutarate dehydrogenase E1 component